MLKLQEMDKIVSVQHQLGDCGTEPVVLVNIFHVAPEQADALLAAWADDARFFRGQPGFISTQLHRGIAGSGTFMNYAIWESVGAFRAAFGSPEFRTKLAQYPDTAIASPHLFRKVAVEGLCVV
jgi:heme-degrading monooxygenase HmoA